MALTKAQLKQLAASQPVNGNRIEAARSLLKLTQLEMQAASGIPQQHISSIENGTKKTVTIPTAHRFAKFFGTSIELLFPDMRQEAVAS
jgi:transcriptional regulator with XRE-family HTH domain